VARGRLQARLPGGRHFDDAITLLALMDGARGNGVGTALCSYALDWARSHGYAGMQFNAVAETNRAAVKLYEQLGFTIVGTVPGAFEHPEEGRVGLHIMYCGLDRSPASSDDVVHERRRDQHRAE
jgi:ribosomal protein S18 acetylase RimI-like enzyme